MVTQDTKEPAPKQPRPKRMVSLAFAPTPAGGKASRHTIAWASPGLFICYPYLLLLCKCIAKIINNMSNMFVMVDNEGISNTFVCFIFPGQMAAIEDEGAAMQIPSDDSLDDTLEEDTREQVGAQHNIICYIMICDNVF